MIRNKKIWILIPLFLLIILIKFSPTYINKWGLMPEWSLKYFEEPTELQIKDIMPNEDGTAILVLEQDYEIPYSDETVILSGFDNNYYNTSTIVNPSDKPNQYYSNLIFQPSEFGGSLGTMYWEGAGGFFSYYVLLISYIIPFLVALTWLITIEKNDSNLKKYSSYIAIWISGSYLFNAVVFHNSKYLAYSYPIMALAVYLGVRYLPSIWNSFTPNYKEKYQKEKLANLFAEAEKERLELMIEGWTKEEFKKIEWNLFNMQFIPKAIEEANGNPEVFKRLLFSEIEEAHQQLTNIKDRTETVTKSTDE